MVTYYLQKTLTTNGNTFGFSGTNIQFAFDESTKVVENIEKKYAVNLQRPRSRASWNSYAATTILIDLKQLKWTWTVTGALCNSSGNLSGVTPSTTALAINKKNLLVAFAEQGGTMSFFHRNFGDNRPVDTAHPENKVANAENVNIMSLEFTDEETEVGASEVYMKVGEQRIGFTMVLQRGSDRG